PASSASPLHLVLLPGSRVGARDLHEAPEDLAALVLVARLMRDRGGAQPSGVGVPVPREGLAGVVDPQVDLGPVDLEMELGRPRAVADPERLCGDLVAG